MKTLIKVKGVLDFNPDDVTKKHKSQSEWKKVALIKTDCDIDLYYSWFLEKRFNLKLNRNLRRTHVTFISDRVDFKLYDKVSKTFNDKEITFYHELEPKSNGEHWWLRVYSPECENIRELCGLSKEPYFGLHLTLGYANEKMYQHSEYILNISKFFNLIDNHPRTNIENYKIYE